MKTKLIEIRDRGTLIIALAIQPGTPDPNVNTDVRVFNVGYEAERWAWARSGYGHDYEAQKQYILLYPIDPDTGAKGNGPLYDPYRWQNKRTMQTAHRWLTEHFDEVMNGDVLDIEFILGESDTPKVSERLTAVTR